MQTRCISCGGRIEGVAQFCDACLERQRLASTADSTQDERDVPLATRHVRPELNRLDVGFLAVIGCVVLGVGVWVLALGGAEDIGLSNGDKPAQGVVTPATETPAASVAPLGFEHIPCEEFTEQPPENADCGYLTVPESRTEANDRRVRLPVVVLKSQSAERRPDPLIYLDGGPGANTLVSLSQASLPFFADRDLVLFDQRGAGSSEPSLDCPEITQLNYDHLERQFTVDQRVAQDAASATRCHDRLVGKGIDPALATSAESAADVNDLMLALGYTQWNLYGVSYGTKLALTVMRDYPQGVRSVILDSTYPLQANLYTELPSNFDRSLRVLFETCAADADCSSAYPGLEAAFYETFRSLNETPVSLALGTVSGRSIEAAVIDGNWFATFIFQSLYSEQLIPLLPRAIFDTRDHEYSLLTVLADAYLQDATSLSAGMYLSVQCGEELSFSTVEAAITAGEAFPQLQSYHEYQAKSVFAACEVWQAGAAAAMENEAVRSDIPTLVLAGQFDPITPPTWGRLAAQELSASFVLDFPGVGHGVAFADPCPLGITQAFLEDPLQAPADDCIDAMSGPQWFVN